MSEQATWPEQEIILAWMKRRNIEIGFNARMELQEELTALRIKAAAPQSSDGWMKDRLEKLEAQLATTYHGPWKFIGGFTQSGAGKVLKQTGERTTIGFGCCDCWFFSKEQGEAVASTLNRLETASPQSSDTATEVESLRKFVEAFKAAYPNIRQLQDGFTTDIQSWSEWDESVRQQTIAQTIALGNMVFLTPAPQDSAKELPSPPEKDKP